MEPYSLRTPQHNTTDPSYPLSTAQLNSAQSHLFPELFAKENVLVQ